MEHKTGYLEELFLYNDIL